MQLTVTKTKSLVGRYRFEVDCVPLPGSPMVGRGASLAEAVGNWVLGNMERVNLSLCMDEETTKFQQRSNSVKIGLHK